MAEYKIHHRIFRDCHIHNAQLCHLSAHGNLQDYLKCNYFIFAFQFQDLYGSNHGMCYKVEWSLGGES